MLLLVSVVNCVETQPEASKADAMILSRKNVFVIGLFVWIALDRLAHDADHGVAIEAGFDDQVA